MAAEAMGYRYENMIVVSADTERAPHDFGAYSSRQTLMSGWAVKKAGEMIKEQVLLIAGEMMNVDPGELDCRTPWFCKKG
jgi:4-hydroxybenzoyl-CoA reductase subunit alpha